MSVSLSTESQRNVQYSNNRSLQIRLQEMIKAVWYNVIIKCVFQTVLSFLSDLQTV
jgi:hypothetical protein